METCALEERNVKNARSSTKSKHQIFCVSRNYYFLFTIRTTKCRHAFAAHGCPNQHCQPHKESVSYCACVCVLVRECSFLCSVPTLCDVYLSHIPIAHKVAEQIAIHKRENEKNASNSNVTRNISDFVFQSVLGSLFDPSVNMDFITFYRCWVAVVEEVLDPQRYPELVQSTNLIVCTTFIASKLESFESQPANFDCPGTTVTIYLSIKWWPSNFKRTTVEISWISPFGEWLLHGQIDWKIESDIVSNREECLNCLAEWINSFQAILSAFVRSTTIYIWCISHVKRGSPHSFDSIARARTIQDCYCLCSVIYFVSFEIFFCEINKGCLHNTASRRAVRMNGKTERSIYGPMLDTDNNYVNVLQMCPIRNESICMWIENECNTFTFEYIEWVSCDVIHSPHSTHTHTYNKVVYVYLFDLDSVFRRLLSIEHMNERRFGSHGCISSYQKRCQQNCDSRMIQIQFRKNREKETYERPTRYFSEFISIETRFNLSMQRRQHMRRHTRVLEMT